MMRTGRSRPGSCIPRETRAPLLTGFAPPLAPTRSLSCDPAWREIVTTSEEAIIRAMKLIWERMKIVVEPSAAVPLAAILEGKLEVRGTTDGDRPLRRQRGPRHPAVAETLAGA